MLDSHITALQGQKAVSAYLSSKQILPFAFARQIRSTDRDRHVQLFHRVAGDTCPIYVYQAYL